MKKFIRIGITAYLIQGAYAGYLLALGRWIEGSILICSGILTTIIVAKMETDAQA